MMIYLVEHQLGTYLQLRMGKARGHGNDQMAISGLQSGVIQDHSKPQGGIGQKLMPDHGMLINILGATCGA